jgi:hypothetical protein
VGYETEMPRSRIPGLGQVDSVRVVDTLYDVGFDGVLSVEHEDPIWSGTDAKVRTALQVAHRTSRPLVVMRVARSEPGDSKPTESTLRMAMQTEQYHLSR